MVKRKILNLNLLLIFVISVIFMPISNATVENTIYESNIEVSEYEEKEILTKSVSRSDIIGKEFFIKMHVSVNIWM